LLKTKLEKFVAKRSLIFFILLAILDIVFIHRRWFLLTGLLLGGILSNLKFSSYALVFSKMIAYNNGNSQHRYGTGKSIIYFIMNQLLILPVLFLALKFNLWFFIGVVAGILLVPLVLFINCITEPLKITHNNFE
jgi:hypothetical protein